MVLLWRLASRELAINVGIAEGSEVPTYEYQCVNCGRFEVTQNITDQPLEACPKCGGSVHRLISRNVNVIFKAAGFYVTDNRSKEYKEKAKEDAGTSTQSSKPSCSCEAAAS
ncbi:MAG: FmdB family zinc ribbon protein [Bacillota bacterium]